MATSEAFEFDLFVSFAQADAAWVEGYLFDALDASQAVYQSEETFALGAPRIAEFERAISSSRRTLLVLTPSYLTDAFAPFTDLLAQTYGLETATWPVIPLILYPVSLPPRLAMLTALDATDPASWEDVLARLLAELQRPVPQAPPKPPCPYPGMAPFAETDSAHFYGRRREIELLVERLRQHPFVAVIGPSGSGKSSLVYAGLIPALRQSGMFGAAGWLVRAMRPGETPLAALSRLLDGDLADLEQAVASVLDAEPEADRLLMVIDQFEETFTVGAQEAEPFQSALARLAQIPHCYVVLTARADFYAELMSSLLWSAIQAHRFEVLPMDEVSLRQAMVLPAEDVGVFVETALVERLVADAAGEPGVLPLVQETMVLLWERIKRRFMSLSAYEALVLSREDDKYADLTGLQVAMARHADHAVAALPGEDRSVARRIILRLVQFGDGRADTRRQQPVSALHSAGEARERFERVLDHLVAARLLTMSGEVEGGARRADIAHEALIDGWPMLRTWLDERREAEQARRRLEGKVAEWQRLGRGSGGLLDEVELLEAERWLSSPDAADLGHSDDLVALVEASRAALEEAERQREAARSRELAQTRALAEEQRRRAEEQTRSAKRLRRVLAGLAVVFVIAVIAGGFAFVQRAEAVRQRERAVTKEAQAVVERNAASTAEAVAKAERNVAATAEAAAAIERDNAQTQYHIALSRQLAAQTLNHLDTQLDLALLLSLQANRIGDSPEVKGSLLAALLPGAHLITYLSAHTDDVRSVAFSPDGMLLATAGADQLIYLWDVATRRPIATLEGHLDQVKSVVFSPDGRYLASASDDKTIILWDVGARQPSGLALVGHEDRVNGVAFSPDGRYLASASSDGTIRLWTLETRQSVVLSGHEDLVLDVAWHPEGSMLASASSDDTVRMWDVGTAAPIGDPLVGHDHSVLSVAFSPDGTLLASGSRDTTIRLWDVESRQPVGEALSAHSDRVAAVAFGPDGALLASGSWDNTLIFWDTRTWEPVGERLQGHTNRVQGLAFSPDGQTLASAGNDDVAVLWDILGRQSLGQTGIRHRDELVSVAASPDGQLLAVGTADREVLLLDLGGKEPISHTLAAHTEGWVNGLVFNPDGTLLASAGDDDRIILWDVERGEPRGQPLVGHTDDVLSVAFSPDGAVLASGGADATVILWDVQTGTPLGLSLKEHADWVNDVEFSPDGTLLASCSWDETAVLWDVASRKPLFEPLTGHGAVVHDVAFSPDGTLLASASGDASIMLWDVDTGDPAGAPLVGHTGAVMSVVFQPTGEWMASGGRDRSIILWHLATRKRIGPPMVAHTNDIQQIAFALQGRALASVGDDRRCVLWDVEFSSWISRACGKVNRNLTDAEWETFTGGNIAYQPSCPDLPSGW